MRSWAAIGLALVLALFAAACGSDSDAAGDDTVSGVVSEVTGDLTTVESFVVLDDNGDSHLFKPEQGLLFYGGPLSHLRDHIVTGQRITVTFIDGAYGDRIAVLVEHEDVDAPHETDGGGHEGHDMGDSTG